MVSAGSGTSVVNRAFRRWMAIAAALDDTRTGRVAFWVIVAVIVGYALAEIWTIVAEVTAGRAGVGFDYNIYMERTRSWLAGGGFYLPRQLAGPYPIADGDAFYPPVALWLFVPFSYLPAILWWAVPTVIIVLSVRHIRPSRFGWVVLGLAAIQTRTGIVWGLGNPSMWAFAALAAGLAFDWPMPLVALKPTLGPFALIGIHRRRWWLGAALVIVLALPFGAMWADYAAIMLNMQPTSSHGLGYVLGEWPAAAALALVGWRWRKPRPGRGSGEAPIGDAARTLGDRRR